MKNTLVSLAAVGLLAQLTTAAPNAYPDAGSGSTSTPTCAAKGYDNGRDSYWDSTDGTYDACSSACVKQSQCKSFGFKSGECHLFNVPVAGNFMPDDDSPYRYYDVSCVKTSSSSTTATSTTAKKIKATSTTTRRQNDPSLKAAPSTTSTSAKVRITPSAITTGTITKHRATSSTTKIWRSTTSASDDSDDNSTDSNSDSDNDDDTPASPTTTRTRRSTTATTPKARTKTPSTIPTKKQPSPTATTKRTTQAKPTTLTTTTRKPATTTTTTQNAQPVAVAPMAMTACSIQNTCTTIPFTDPCNRGCGCTYTETCGQTIIGTFIESGLTGLTHAQCVRACDVRQSTCVGFTFTPDSGECWLYSAITGTDTANTGFLGRRGECANPCPASS